MTVRSLHGPWMSLPILVLLVAAVSADDEKARSSLRTPEGWINCATFLRMDEGQKGFYLLGLSEGVKLSEFGIRANLESEKALNQAKPAMLELANMLEHLIDHSKVTYSEIMKRTEIQCERNPTASAHFAWLKAIKEIQ